jgi:AAA15 family ATPase/GTPase
MTHNTHDTLQTHNTHQTHDTHDAHQSHDTHQTHNGPVKNVTVFISIKTWTGLTKMNFASLLVTPRNSKQCLIDFLDELDHSEISLFQIKNTQKKAGLSKATLKISSEFSSKFSQRTHNSKSIEWLLRYSNSNIWRPSSYGARLHLKDLYNIVWSSKLKFKIRVGSHKWLLRCSIFTIFRSSSIGGLPHLNVLQNTVWSCKLRFTI